MRSIWLAGSVVLLVAILGTGTVSADVHWKNGQISTATPMAPAELRQTLTGLAVRDASRHVVVHLDRPADARLRGDLAASGVRLLGYLGDRSYFASLTASVDPLGAAGVKGLLAVEAVAPSNKLHQELAAGVIRPWSIVSPDKLNPVQKPGEPAPDPIVAVYVLFHPDTPLDTTATQVIAGAGGTVDSKIRAIHGVVAHLRASRITALAEADPVMFVEPPLPPLSEINDSNRPRVEADIAQAPPYSLDGSGVTVLVYDGGKMFAHGDFGTRLTIGPSDTSGISDHATHVGGTIGGDGSGSAGQYRGMAPNVDIISYGFEQEGGLSEGFLYTDPGDIEADYGEAINTFGADVANNSIGTNTASNGYPCEWEGNYGATGVLIDSIARGFFGEPFRIVWANGNERSSGACGTTYVTTAPPACAKNHITVGAMNSNDDSVTSFTSWGPCDDGRLKPDISAPGCQSNDDNGVTSTSSSGGYNSKCGTSMAAPTTTGVVALMLQQYRQSFPATPDPRNATVKAILATTAVDIETTGPDYKTGYGSIRTIPAVDLIAEERFVEAEVGQDEVYSFIILVDPGDPELKVTIAWDDVPGTPNVDPVLVNDLDLRVLGPDGTPYMPWTLDPANPANPAVQTVRDGLNNIEQVVITSPGPGAYRVEVKGFNIASGLTQSFGAAALPSLINCAPTGILAASTSRISCSDDLVLDVIDCDLNTDDAVVESVVISVSSTTEPAGESLTLIESAPETAAFSGSITVSTTNAAGVLWITEGDTITATYIDADDGLGGTNVPVTRNVIVDCTAPVVLGTAVLDLNHRDATVEVTADEPVRLAVNYGTACGTPTESVSFFSLNTVHEANLRNLQDNTTYYYTIDVADEAGNSSSDDNGGACYTFTTPEIPDFFTEQFGSGNDTDFLRLEFLPNGAPDFYQGCSSSITGFPTDPAGGTVLSLTDDSFATVTLTVGNSVSLYGVPYSTFYVGSNGYITFNTGSSDYTESLAEHFGQPRISAIYDDLNPASTGTVSWLELSDRVVVTWEGVTEYSPSNINDFQIEMFFSGVIAINYLTVDVNDGLAGLSEGNGLSPDFFDTDLSAMASCGVSCFDGILNQDEVRIDCGGVCAPCECLADPECDDGLFCTGIDICDTFGRCAAGSDPCPGEACHEGGNSCVECLSDVECDDGLFCNGTETCGGNICRPGLNMCPYGICDEVRDTCVTCDNDGTCEPGEDCANCPNDCIRGSRPVCGNGICEVADGEDCLSCPDDCNGLQTGGPSLRYCCGDGIVGQGAVTCADGRCNAGGNTCAVDPVLAYCCGDATCNDIEVVGNCPADCTVTVPGEAGAAGTLLVTAFDPATGMLSVSFGSTCAATDYTLEYGELTKANLAAYDWSGQECFLGDIGTHDWSTSGLPDALFFVVVGNNGIDEGSYGTDGRGAERPEDAVDGVCPMPQNLQYTCQ